MASFQAPPGHLSQAEVLIISSLVEYQLTVNAPDPDLEVPLLLKPKLKQVWTRKT